MSTRFLIFFIFVYSHFFSQEKKDTSKLFPKIKSVEFLNIGGTVAGLSIYRLTNATQTSASALPGIKLDIGYNIQMYKHIGIKSMLLYQNNQLDDKQYLRDLRAKNPLNAYSMSQSGWNNISALLGVFGNFNLGKQIHFQPKFCYGFNYGISPKIDLTVTDSLKNTFIISEKRGNAIAFSFLLGADFKIDLAKKYQLLFGFDAFISDLVFENIRVENSSSNLVNFYTASEGIGTLGFKIGIAKIVN